MGERYVREKEEEKERRKEVRERKENGTSQSRTVTSYKRTAH